MEIFREARDRYGTGADPPALKEQRQSCGRDAATEHNLRPPMIPGMNRVGAPFDAIEH